MGKRRYFVLGPITRRCFGLVTEEQLQISHGGIKKKTNKQQQINNETKRKHSPVLWSDLAQADHLVQDLVLGFFVQLVLLRRREDLILINLDTLYTL